MNKSKIILEKTKSYKSILQEIDYKLSAPEILADIVETRELSKKRSELSEIVNLREKLENTLRTKEELLLEQSASNEENKNVYAEMLDELTAFESRITLKLLSLLVEKDSEENEEMILEIRSGKECVEFQEKVLKMYANFATLNDLFVERRSNTLFLKGKNVRSLFESATALHKWADGKTLVVEVCVYPIFKSQKVEIKDNDVRVDIFLAHGKGGQNINKVETAVRLTHFASGTVVTCQDERSQLKNKERAFLRLREILQKKQDEEFLLRQKDEQERLTREMRGNQRKFFPAESKFSDSRVDIEIDLDSALKGNLNEIVEAILLEKIR